MSPPLRAFVAGVGIVFVGCAVPRAPPRVEAALPSSAETAPPSEDALPDPPPSTVTEVPVACEGEDVDLSPVFGRGACLVPASTVDPAAWKLPASVKVELESTPASLGNHERAVATLSIRNTARDPAAVYLRPQGQYIWLSVNLIDTKTLQVHRVGGAYMTVPEGPSQALRIVLAPAGRAHIALSWAAVRQVGGHVPKMTPSSQAPLLPGKYLLVAWTGFPGISPRDVDQTRTPSAPITIVPSSSPED